MAKGVGGEGLEVVMDAAAHASSARSGAAEPSAERVGAAE